MDTLNATKEALASTGAKLKTHEIHLRRTANKGFIARHDLRDKKGRPPMDGQRDSAEYGLANHEELLEHIKQHMGPEDPEPDE